LRANGDELRLAPATIALDATKPTIAATSKKVLVSSRRHGDGTDGEARHPRIVSSTL